MSLVVHYHGVCQAAREGRKRSQFVMHTVHVEVMLSALELKPRPAEIGQRAFLARLTTPLGCFRGASRISRMRNLHLGPLLWIVATPLSRWNAQHTRSSATLRALRNQLISSLVFLAVCTSHFSLKQHSKITFPPCFGSAKLPCRSVTQIAWSIISKSP